MSATITLTEDDFVAANRLAARPTRRWWVLHAFGAAALVLLAVLASSPIVRIGALGAFLGGLLAYVGLRFVLGPMAARRAFRAGGAAGTPIEIGLEDDGVAMRAGVTDEVLQWKRIRRWREDEHCVLLYEEPRAFRFVPKRVAAQGFDVEALREGLRRHVGAPDLSGARAAR